MHTVESLRMEADILMAEFICLALSIRWTERAHIPKLEGVLARPLTPGAVDSGARPFDTAELIKASQLCQHGSEVLWQGSILI